MISTLSKDRLVHNVRVSHLSVLLLILILAILTGLVSSFAFAAESLNNKSAAVLLTFALNGFLGIVFLCKSIIECSFSLVQMHWAFYVTMFVIAPFSQYLCGYYPWGYSLSVNDYLATNLALTCWGLLFALFSGVQFRDRTCNQSSFYESLPNVRSSTTYRALLVSLAVSLMVVAFVGFGNLFSRGTYSMDLDKTAGLLFDKFLRPLPVFAFVLFLMILILQN